jgi:hypothetical protein
MTDNNNDFATKFANALEGMFESVALTRKQHFIDNPAKRPSQQDIDSLA